ncbi:hypothetical protein [Solibacillus sp.]|uniref:hypothetical protein n=1 Tax=Solibacillus sp. TaxID=1909654 RepID=UPI0033151842
MEINLITAIFGAIGTFVGFIITIATYSRNRDKDIHSKASEQATINAKLDTINGGVDSLRVDFKVEQKERAALSERVTRVEESVSSAHKRLNKLEGE